MSNQIQLVSFHNQQITVLNHENKPYIEMRSIVENIGLDWGAQLKRIKRNNILNSTMVIMTTVAKDGKNRELVCLPLGYLNGWLFGIDTNRVKPEIRPTLEQYQLECFDVLYNHFMPKVAQKFPNTITTEQKYQIRKAVNERVHRTGEKHQAIYHKLYDQFKINSYEALPANKFDEAIDFLGGVNQIKDNYDVLVRLLGHLETVNESQQKLLQMYMYQFEDFIENLSPSTHYNISTLLNKIKVNIGLALNYASTAHPTRLVTTQKQLTN